MSQKSILLESPVYKTFAEEFFHPWEQEISSFDMAISAINSFADKAGKLRTLAWRGVKSASYPLHSSLYRELFKYRSSVDDTELIRYEVRMLEHAKMNWRFNGVNGLELLANLQHYGAPTRLIDVTYNPLIALWFACQEIDLHDEPTHSFDGRLFAFDVTNRHLEITDSWDTNGLPWHYEEGIFKTTKWNTELPLIWKPQNYNERIAAQNSAFLIGGIPGAKTGSNTKYRREPGDGTKGGTWSISEVRQATSVTSYMFPALGKPTSRSTPTITFRIAANAKGEIVENLRHYYGIQFETLFPDIYGMASTIGPRVMRELGARHPSRRTK